MPINIKIYPEKKFCCEKHEILAEKAREEYLETRYNSNIVDIRSVLQQVSKMNNNFLARETLKAIMVVQLRKNGHVDSMTMEQIDLFLDQCIMSEVNQLRRQCWAHERERRENLGVIPVAIYDGQHYLYGLADILKDLDRKLI